MIALCSKCYFVYDFESFHDSTKRKKATDSLTYENVQGPILVSISDTLERAPTHICDPDAKELIRKLMEKTSGCQ